jgi:hypothetical protein
MASELNGNCPHSSLGNLIPLEYLAAYIKRSETADPIIIGIENGGRSMA